MSDTNRKFAILYKAALQFANALTTEQREGATPEAWATDHTNKKMKMLPKLARAERRAGMNR